MSKDKIALKFYLKVLSGYFDAIFSRILKANYVHFDGHYVRLKVPDFFNGI